MGLFIAYDTMLSPPKNPPMGVKVGMNKVSMTKVGVTKVGMTKGGMTKVGMLVC